MQLREGGRSHARPVLWPLWPHCPGSRHQPMDLLQLRAGEHLAKIQESCSQAGWHQHCPLSEPPPGQHHGDLIHPLPLGFTPQDCMSISPHGLSACLERHNHPEQGGSPRSTAQSWRVPEGTGGNSVIHEQSRHPAQHWGSRKLQPLRTESGLQTSPEQIFLQRFIYSWLLRGFSALVLVESREHSLSLTTLPLLGPSSSHSGAEWCSEGTRGRAETGGAPAVTTSLGLRLS